MLHKILGAVPVLVGSLDFLHDHLSFASGGHRRCEVKGVVLLEIRFIFHHEATTVHSCDCGIISANYGLQFDTADKMKFPGPEL